MRLETWDRFEQLCFRLARSEYPNAFPMSLGGSWDGGRDIVALKELDSDGDVVFQCKFSKNLSGNTRKAVAESVARVVQHYENLANTKLDQIENFGPESTPPPLWRIRKWILCIPTKTTGRFLDWIRNELEPHDFQWEIWDETELLRRLETRTDLVETFFYSTYAELREYFQTEELELVRFKLDSECQWRQADASVLQFSRSENVVSPDLVFDVIVRNRGSIETILLSIGVEVGDVFIKFHGIPGEGLLFPQITYSVSLHHGEPGRYEKECEPPLIIRPNGVERFKIRFTDTGYSWIGGVCASLAYGKNKHLRLPCIRLFT